MFRPLLACTAVLLCVLPKPADAQAQANTGELHIFGGYLLGQALVPSAVAGFGLRPRVADHATYGARLDYNFTPDWGVELSAEQTPTHTTSQIPGVQNRLRLQAAEMDVTWNFSPHSPVVGYTLMGAGYARARLDQPLTGLVNGQSTTIMERGSVTGNLGLGARAYLGPLILRAEVRYRYVKSLVDPGGRPLSLVEATAGLGVRF